MDDGLLLEWYKNLHQERWERSRRTWITISLFITGSFLLLLEAIKTGAELGTVGFIFLMIIAIGLLVVSWFIEFCTIKHNELALECIKRIEKDLNFPGPERRHEEEEKIWWFKLRRRFWHILFLFLICSYFPAMILFSPPS